MDETCHPVGHMCSVNAFSSGVILTFLTLVPWFSVYVSDTQRHVRYMIIPRCSDSDACCFFFCDCGKLGLLYMISLLTFVAEAVALPFGTKREAIAFVLLDDVGLHWTLLATMVCIGIMRASYDRECCQVLSHSRYKFLVALSLVGCVLHACVALGLHIAEHWEFVTWSWFYLDWKREFVWHRVLRTVFSVCCALDFLALQWYFYKLNLTGTMSLGTYRHTAFAPLEPLLMQLERPLSPLSEPDL